MNKCPECGSRVAETDNNCRKCGSLIHGYVRPNTDQKLVQDRLRDVEFERKHYQLAPRQYGETDEQYINRIDREKTPAVLAEHKAILDSWYKSGYCKPGDFTNPMFAKMAKMLAEKGISK